MNHGTLLMPSMQYKFWTKLPLKSAFFEIHCLNLKSNTVVVVYRIKMAEKDHKNTGPRLEDVMVVEKIDAIIDRISGHKNVEGVIVCDKDGAAIQTTMDNTNTVMYAEGIRNAATMASSLVRDVDPENELEYIRIGTKKLEMLAHLDPDYLAIVIQGRIKPSKKDES